MNDEQLAKFKRIYQEFCAPRGLYRFIDGQINRVEDDVFAAIVALKAVRYTIDRDDQPKSKRARELKEAAKRGRVLVQERENVEPYTLIFGESNNDRTAQLELQPGQSHNPGFTEPLLFGMQGAIFRWNDPITRGQLETELRRIRLL